MALSSTGAGAGAGFASFYYGLGVSFFYFASGATGLTGASTGLGGSALPLVARFSTGSFAGSATFSCSFFTAGLDLAGVLSAFTFFSGLAFLADF